MIAQLKEKGKHLGLATCVLTFEPHPRDYFATTRKKTHLLSARVTSLRDKLIALKAFGIDRVVLLRFNHALASLAAQEFIHKILYQGLNARYVLVGDDFRFGYQRQGDYSMLQSIGNTLGFQVEAMPTYQLQGHRVSSSLVRQALEQGDMAAVHTYLGRPYSISGHIVYGRRLGRELGFPTLNLRFKHPRPAAHGIFVARIYGLSDTPLPGIASFGTRPTLDLNDYNKGQVLLETYCLEWPDHLKENGAYGKYIKVELLKKLHEERRYTDIDSLKVGIAQDVDFAKAYFQRHELICN
jgi:riboflavin kinase/FMN adenylyltransferase